MLTCLSKWELDANWLLILSLWYQAKVCGVNESSVFKCLIILASLLIKVNYKGKRKNMEDIGPVILLNCLPKKTKEKRRKEIFSRIRRIPIQICEYSQSFVIFLMFIFLFIARICVFSNGSYPKTCQKYVL